MIQFLKYYVAGGGRTILVGELGPLTHSSPGNGGIQHIMTQFGSPVTVSPGEASFVPVQGLDGPQAVEEPVDLSRMDGTGRYDLDR